jgi:zinc transporter, ZIP family
VIGAVIALRIRIPLRVIGLIMGFGAGVLISAVAFDLAEEAAAKSTGDGALVAGLFAGCLLFFGGDRLIDHLANTLVVGNPTVVTGVGVTHLRYPVHTS